MGLKLDALKTLVGMDTRDPRFVGTSFQNSTLLKPGQAINFNLMEWFAQFDPYAFRIAYGISRDIFENWFEITDLDDEVIDELNDQFQLEAERLNLYSLYTTAIYHEKWGGYSIIVDWEKFPNLKPVERFEVFNRNQFEINYNRSNGAPEIYRVQVDLGDFVRFVDVPADFVTHIVTRPLFSKTIGLSVLSPVYQTIIDYWHLRFQSGQTFARHGPGFLLAKVMKGAKAEDVTAANRIIDRADETTGIITKETVEWEFIGPSGKVLDPTTYADVFMKAMSAGSFIPKTVMEGIVAGAKLGSEENKDDFFKFIKGEQELVDNGIRRHIIDSDILEDSEWKITWNEPSLDREDDEPDEDGEESEEEPTIIEENEPNPNSKNKKKEKTENVSRKSK